MPILPREIADLTDEQIQDLANSIDKEDDVLKSFGIKDSAIKRIKTVNRWRLNWDTGRAKFIKNYNKGLVESEDSSIQKVIAEHTLPKVETIQEGFEFVIDAPEWFVKGQTKGQGRRGKKTKA